MTTTAKELAKNLGLEDYLDTARISFFYRSVPQSFLIVYDSQNKNRIITKQIIKNYGNIGVYRDGDALLDFSPPVDLTRFNGNIKGIFITYDIAPDIKLNGRTPYTEELALKKIKVYKF